MPEAIHQLRDGETAQFAVAEPSHREHPQSAAHYSEALRDTQMPVSEQRGRHVQRSGQPRRFQDRTLAGTREHFDFQIFVKYQLLVSADPFEEVERLDVATHQDVLPVVDEISGVRLGERIRTPAGRGFSFEHCDPHAPLGERNRCAESREPGADHDHVFHRRYHLIRHAHPTHPCSAPQRPTAHARPTR